LNYTIPADYVEKYDVVVDMGTLEHLANLSTALRNIFGLLKMSGIYYFGVPCNNWVNHGFFQFSPTFFLDLCTDNPGLDLLELDLRTESKLYNYASLNPAFIQALLCSQRKLAVGGVIQKKQSGIDLNLTQSKYRYLHTLGRADGGSRHLVDYPPARQVTLSLARRVLGKALDVFCRTSLVPLVVKELVISRLYRLPRAISEERIKGRIHL
jgi:hypothetical protein